MIIIKNDSTENQWEMSSYFKMEESTLVSGSGTEQYLYVSSLYFLKSSNQMHEGMATEYGEQKHIMDSWRECELMGVSRVK